MDLEANKNKIFKNHEIPCIKQVVKIHFYLHMMKAEIWISK